MSNSVYPSIVLHKILTDLIVYDQSTIVCYPSTIVLLTDLLFKVANLPGANPTMTIDIRPSLVYCLLPIHMCSKNRGEWEVITDFLLCQCTNANHVYICFKYISLSL